MFIYDCRICYLFFFFFENFKISSLYLTFKKTSFIVFMIQSSLMSRNLTQRKCINIIVAFDNLSELPKSWAFILYIICHTFISVYSYVLDSGIFLRICILISLFGFSFQEMLLILWSLLNECNTSSTLWIFLLKYSWLCTSVYLEFWFSVS